MRRSDAALLTALGALAGSLYVADASAQCTALRPTDPTGTPTYGGAEATSFAAPGGAVRVWYTTGGSHAPPPESTQPDGTPDFVVTTAEVLDDALAAYVEMGFRAPVGDGTYPACASNGGDGLLDIYLAHFPAADGQVVTEQCQVQGTKTVCAGFMVMENDFNGGGYPSLEIGIRTVAPHELFHLVQDAYDVDVDRWFAEGSAQWAADSLDPSLTDLESYLPEYFSEIDRPIDQPPGGVVAGFLYGTAAWPVYLAETQGPEMILSVFEALNANAGDVLDATDIALAGGLGDEFVRFMGYNAATGSRAASGQGYAGAAGYPEVTYVTLSGEPSFTHEGLHAGLAGHFYYLPAGVERLVSLDTDPTRNGGYLVPLSGGVADLAAASPLPAEITGEAMVVVAGRTPAKTDAPYTIVVEPAPPDEGTGGQGGAPANPPGGDATSADDDGGCSCRSGPPSQAGGWMFLLAAALLGLARRRDR